MSSFLRNSRSVLSQLLRRYKPAQPRLTRCYQRAPAPPLPAACPRSKPPTNTFRTWYEEPRKITAAVVLSYATVSLLPQAAVFTACCAISHEEKVPCINRVHRVYLSPSEECEQGDLAFDAFKKEHGDNILGASDPSTIRVRRVTNDIIRGIHRVLVTKSHSDDDDNDNYGGSSLPQTSHLVEVNWEVIVVKDKRSTAYSRLGGKIIVHTGLLQLLGTDAEIATVLAHEIGHFIARHLTEIGRCTPFFYELLPFSRRCEMEADYIGIMLLAAAGFDPRVAPRVYQKLGEKNGDSPWKDYISSHPSSKTRSRLLSQGKVMEEALELYHRHVCAREGAH